MFASLLAPILGAVAGGLVNNGGNQATTESKREPWAPAQPYILDNLRRGQELQRHYEQNPFNPQQIQNYSNLFSDTQNFRNNTMPGLMDFANRGMTSSYQRQAGGAPGSGGGYGGAVRPGGLLQSGVGAFASPMQGQSSQPGQSGQIGGLLDLNGAQNPFSGANRPAAAPVAAPVDPLAGLSPEMLEFLKQMMAANRPDNYGTGNGASGAASGGVGGLGVGDSGTGGSAD